MFVKGDRVIIIKSDVDIDSAVIYTGIVGTVHEVDDRKARVFIKPDTPRFSNNKDHGFWWPTSYLDFYKPPSSTVTVSVDVEVDLANVNTSDLLAEIARRVRS